MPRIDPPRISDAGLLDLPPDCSAAAVAYAGADQWHRFATSYRLAADTIAAEIAGRPARSDLLAVPLMFLYRHYVALSLKSLLLDAGALLDDPQQVPPRHYLLSLWERVRPLLLRVDGRSDGPWLERAELVIRQFDGLDPQSFSFRYPVGTDGNESFASPLKVCPAVVKQVVDELSIVLEGASSQIDVYTGLKHEHM